LFIHFPADEHEHLFRRNGREAGRREVYPVREIAGDVTGFLAQACPEWSPLARGATRLTEDKANRQPETNMALAKGQSRCGLRGKGWKQSLGKRSTACFRRRRRAPYSGLEPQERKAGSAPDEVKARFSDYFRGIVSFSPGGRRRKASAWENAGILAFSSAAERFPEPTRDISVRVWHTCLQQGSSEAV